MDQEVEAPADELEAIFEDPDDLGDAASASRTMVKPGTEIVVVRGC